MTDDPDNPVSSAQVRVMQIMAAALVIGPTFFLALSLFLVQVQNRGQGLAPPSAPVLTILAAAMFVISTATAFVVPGLVVRYRLQRIASGAEPDAVSQVRALPIKEMIIGRALHEGAAFLGCIAYLMEAQPLALGVAGLAILLMLIRFPTEYRVKTWMRRQLDWLEKAREQVSNPPDGA